MTKFKVGDRLRFVGNKDDYRKNYKNIKVEAVFDVDGGMGGDDGCRIWISFDNSGRRDTATIFSDEVWEAWELVPPMFEVGVTYRPKIGTYTTKILDVFEVETPATEGDRVTAVGRVTQADGGQYINILGAWERKYYEEVK